MVNFSFSSDQLARKLQALGVICTDEGTLSFWQLMERSSPYLAESLLKGKRNAGYHTILRRSLQSHIPQSASFLSDECTFQCTLFYPQFLLTNFNVPKDIVFSIWSARDILRGQFEHLMSQLLPNSTFLPSFSSIPAST